MSLPSTRDDQVSETTPLRLKLAVRLGFPQGGMTVSGLRREEKKGNITFEVIAGKQFTTLADIKQMRAKSKCREERKAPVSISASSVGGVTPYGSSSTEKTKSALASAQMIAEGLKKPSPITSQGSTSQTGRIVTLRK
jgi:hypothetical protein